MLNSNSKITGIGKQNLNFAGKIVSMTRYEFALIDADGNPTGTIVACIPTDVDLQIDDYINFSILPGAEPVPRVAAPAARPPAPVPAKTAGK
jgi:hypothetical protein